MEGAESQQQDESGSIRVLSDPITVLLVPSP